MVTKDRGRLQLSTVGDEEVLVPMMEGSVSAWAKGDAGILLVHAGVPSVISCWPHQRKGRKGDKVEDGRMR